MKLVANREDYPMTRPGICPDERDLRRYAQGQLKGAAEETITGHLRMCDTCIETVQNLQKTPTQQWPADLPAPGKNPPTFLSEPGGESNTINYDFLNPPRAADELGRLGGYRVRKLLGQGGMGLVFLAEDLHLERTVALKVLSPKLARDRDFHDRFVREARSAAALKSDHIVTIYQAGEDKGLPFLAMEFLQGESLDRWLDEGHWPTIAQTIRVAAEIATGLAAAHERGLIHRDIKPANIWLEAPRGRVKILDFGLARMVSGDQHLTQTGMIVGTPAYMSPEQARSETLDARSDLFSLGCVLYELLAHELPFQGASVMAQLTALMVDEPRPLTELNPEVPPGLQALVRHLLQKKPVDRPSSAMEVLEKLHQLDPEAFLPAVTSGSSPQARKATAIMVAARDVSVPEHPLESIPVKEKTRVGTKKSGTKGKRSKRSSRLRQRQDTARPWRVAAIVAGLLLAIVLGAGLVLWFRPPPPGGYPGPYDQAHIGMPPPGGPGGPPGGHPPPKLGDLWKPGEPVPPGWPKNKPMPAGWRHGDPVPSDVGGEPDDRPAGRPPAGDRQPPPR